MSTMLTIDLDTQRAILSLLADDSAIVHVSQAFPAHWASSVADWIETHPRRSNGKQLAGGRTFESSVDQLGVSWVPLYHARLINGSVEQTQLLEEEAEEYAKELSNFCAPALPPIEALYHYLQRLWPSGASLARFEYWSTSLGYTRIQHSRRNRKIENDPHVDKFPFALLPVDRTFSAVVYLRLPPEGGELELWDCKPDEYRSRLKEFATIDRSQLPPPDVTISPHPGDVVFLNSARPHAVRGFSGGMRIVQTCSVGVRDTHPLVLWS